MIFKAIIFDLDGVICHTDNYHYKAWKKLADEKNLYFDETMNHRLRGVSRMESLNIILEQCPNRYSDDEKIELAERKNNIYVDSLKSMTTDDFSPEVKETLEQLRNKGYVLAIGSSSKNAKTIMKRIGCAAYFQVVSDGNNIKNSKPDPEVFLIAAERLGFSPDKCLVVEDARAGIDAAVAGGFQSAGIGEAADYGKTTYPLSEFKDLLKIV